MKYTSYKQIKEATTEELCSIDPDIYSDEELWQIQKWLFQLKQEQVKSDELIGLSKNKVHQLNNFHKNS